MPTNLLASGRLVQAVNDYVNITGYVLKGDQRTAN
jgi:hypothetical protein